MCAERSLLISGSLLAALGVVIAAGALWIAARADDGIRSRNLLLGGAAGWFPLGQGGRLHSRTGSVFGTSREQCGLYCRGPSASIIVGCPVCRAIASKSRSQCSRVRPDSSATAATRRSTGPALRCSP